MTRERFVIPAEAGIQGFSTAVLDPGLRRGDDRGAGVTKRGVGVTNKIVIPAKAGIQGVDLRPLWIPGRATLARNDGGSAFLVRISQVGGNQAIHQWQVDFDGIPYHRCVSPVVFVSDQVAHLVGLA